MLPDFSSLESFVRWLASVPGAVVAVGFFVSYVLERLSFWHKTAKDLKAALVLILAYGVSYGAQEFLSSPLILGNQDLNAVFLFLVSYASTQVAYKKFFKV